jgi:hypothetical protein
MAKTVTKKDLNAAGCDSDNCKDHDHSVLYLHADCHIGAATVTRYEKKTETLVIECAECEKEVVRIKL